MQLTYKPSDKPSWGKVIVFAIQQVLAILAATIVVPTVLFPIFAVHCVPELFPEL